jgi:peroxiredoxin
MAMTTSKGLALGTPAPPFSGLEGVDGERYGLGDFEDAKALVIVFTCNHCPVAEAYEDRLVAIDRDYRPKGVRIVAINPNDAEQYPGDSLEAMKERAAAKGFGFPYVRDATQEVAKAYQAACTPDPFVFDGALELVYNGRIDDSWKDPSAVTTRDLRRVLDAVLAGEPIGFEPTPAMGCAIKWKP